MSNQSDLPLATPRQGEPAEWSRRDLARMLGSVGIGLVMVPALVRPGLASTDLTIQTWSGYELPEFHQAYIDAHGGSPSYTFFGDQEEALQKVRAGFKPDLSHPCNSYLARWRDSGVLKPIDVERLRHWPDLWGALKELPEVHHGGQYWLVPFDWGNASVLYRTDLVEPGQEDTWEILYDERYAGRIGMYEDITGVALVSTLVAGAKDPFAPTPEEMERIREVMRRQRDLVRFYWTDQTSIEQGLASGELVASYAWNSTLLSLKEQGLPVAFMNPKEGILTWVCGMALIDGGEGDEQSAYDYIDAMIAPESGQHLIEAYGYGHSNRKAFDLVDPERLDLLGISDPESFLSRGVFFQPTAPEIREEFIQMFDEILAGG